MDASSGGRDLLSRLVAELFRTRTAQDVIDKLIPEVIRLWAGQNYLKKTLSQRIEKRIRKGFERIKQSPEFSQYTASVFEEPEFISAFAGQFLTLLNDATDAAGVLSKTIEKLPSGEKERLVGEILAKMNYARSGELLTTYARIINEIHKSNPTFFADRIDDRFTKLIEQIDFGELKDLADNSAHDAEAALKKINAVMWQYPAKAVCLISILPTMLNLFVTSLKESTKQFNNISPDLLTDVMLSLMRHIDGKAIGEFINELSELVRKLHTGSALLGDPNMPQFPRELSKILEELAGTVDGRLLWKARVAVAEGKESLENTWVETLKKSPELLTQMINNYPSIRNAHIRALSKKLAFIEGLPEKESAEAVALAASELDMVELAETFNLFCALTNRIHALKPDIVSSMAAQFTNSIDAHEFQKTVKWLAGDIAKSFKPLVRAAWPQIMNAICDCLKPDNDEHQKDIEDALASLRKLLEAK